MRRGIAGIAALLAMAAFMVPGVSSATPDDGVAVAYFHCQTTLLFPSIGTNATKTQCDGSATGVAVATAGKPGVAVSLDIPPSTALTKGEGNFDAYNITYREECTGGVFPDAGFASGEATVGGTVVGDGPAFIHAHFDWERHGIIALVTLSGVHAHNGTPDKHKGGAGSAGVAIATLIPKPTVGTCATPNPQQEVMADGIVVTTVGL